MRPIRRFGSSTSFISDRLAAKSHDKITSSLGRQSWSATVDDERRKLRSLVYANNYASSAPDKENRRIEDLNGITRRPDDLSLNGFGRRSDDLNGLTISPEKTEVIINTPAFQLVCDRRRTANHTADHQRHSSADEVFNIICSADDKPAKSAMKKSQNGVLPAAHRSRWSSFSRRSVSFADDKGLQLTEIKLIDMYDPRDDVYSPYGSYSASGRQASGFIADFILPPAYRRLRSLQVLDTASPPVASSQIVLESYTSSRWSVTGIVAVRSNSDAIGAKRVFVRYTNDQWTTSTDNEASLAPPDGTPRVDAIERYTFTLPFPLRPQTGSRLEFKFGVRMPAGVGGVLSAITYWDDNHGSNYSFTFV